MDASAQFLQEKAAKHFVCLAYRSTFPNEPEKFHLASCFVVEVEGHWFLITAGHVIRNIRDAKAAGAEVSWLTIHDQTAGHSYEHGVPLELNLKGWVQLEDDPMQGTDYAATALHPLTVDALKKGGIEPIREDRWGAAPYGAYQHWVLTGIPTESHSQVTETKHVVKFTLIPLDKAPAPEGKELPSRVYATIRDQPQGGVVVNDIDGMSGGPVFGIITKQEGGRLRYRYWVIGVQSGWYDARRLLFFCPAQPFFAVLKKTVQEVVKQLAEEASNSSPAPSPKSTFESVRKQL